MAEIQVLAKEVAELIAAGEVVERPASIVKELIENAVDAGASAVTVELADGGVGLIRVTDDGCGIAPTDIPKAFLRHATSKIRAATDLDSILTLGFRGEALASVAAMCRVEITTKEADATEGARCLAQGGEIGPVEPAGCPRGTIITVRDVFYNTPARIKFLKKNTSEAAAAAQVVDRCALTHPDIAFRFIREGKTTLQTAGNGDLLAVIYAVYGKEQAASMTRVDYLAENGIRVSGYISKPEGGKPSRAFQNFSINDRPARIPTALAALEQAYKNKIMAGRFPACVLNIELDARGVDVNVHPAKTEVRFADEKPVFHAVYFAAKTALTALEGPLAQAVSEGEGREDSLVPERREPEKTPDRQPVRESGSVYGSGPLYGIGSARGGEPARPMTMDDCRVLFGGETAGFSQSQPLNASRAGGRSPDVYVEEWDAHPTDSAKISPVPGSILKKDAAIPAQNATIKQEAPSFAPGGYRLIGEVFGTYILLELEGALALVDKHAAHERILYQRLKESLAQGNRQVLLTPATVTLPREEHTALLENLSALEGMGFLAEDFGGGAIIVRETPLDLAQADIAHILLEIADKIKRGLSDLTPAVLDRLYYSIACRSALKAGDKNAAAELKAIVELLRENPDATHCPHGRPVSVKLARRDIEKLFGRQG